MLEIDSKQIEFIHKDLKGHNILLGSAGSGKTVLALAKFRDILAKDPLSKNLFVTYNATLAEQFKVNVRQIKEAERGYRLFSASELPVDVYTYHALFLKLLSTKYSDGKPIYPKEKKRPEHLIRGAIWYCRKLEDNSEYEKHWQYFKDEISFIQGFGRRSLEEYINEERIGCRIKNLPREKRRFYWAVYERYKYLLEKECLCDYDGAGNALISFLEEHHPNGIYDNIIIDEAQDFSPMVIASIVRLLKKDGMLLYLGDEAQEIYGKRMSWKSSGLQVRNKITRLQKNYRNTKEIADFANTILTSDVLQKNLTEVLLSETISRGGEKPMLIDFIDEDIEIMVVCQLIRALKGKESICILCYQNEALKRWQKVLKIHNIKAAICNSQDKLSEDATVFLSTYHSIKGLEFDNIIALDVNEDFLKGKPILEGEDMEQYHALGLRLLYVAATRAKNRLVIGFKGNVFSLFPQGTETITPIDGYDAVKHFMSRNRSREKDAWEIALGLSSVQPLSKVECKNYFQTALNQAEKELNILSPWIRGDVVDEFLIDKLRILLRKGVKVKILYGIGEEDAERKVMKAVENNKNKHKKHVQLEKLAGKDIETEKLAQHLKNELKGYPGFEIKRTNSHGKLLICDHEFCIVGSYNWLSYNGQGERDETGSLIKDEGTIEDHRRKYFDF